MKRIAERHANKVCYACRWMGHAAQLYPNVKPEDQAKGSNPAGICYRYDLRCTFARTMGLIHVIDADRKSIHCLGVGKRRTRRIRCRSRLALCVLRKVISRQVARKIRTRAFIRTEARVNSVVKLRISQRTVLCVYLVRE